MHPLPTLRAPDRPLRPSRGDTHNPAELPGNVAQVERMICAKSLRCTKTP